MFLNSCNSFEFTITSFTLAKLQKEVYSKCSNFMSRYCPFASQQRDQELCYYSIGFILSLRLIIVVEEQNFKLYCVILYLLFDLQWTVVSLFTPSASFVVDYYIGVAFGRTNCFGSL